LFASCGGVLDKGYFLFGYASKVGAACNVLDKLLGVEALE
jgi:hypothetical protein